MLGEDKKSMLKEALQLVASNVELQRLFAEFNDLLEANRDDLMDVQSALEWVSDYEWSDNKTLDNEIYVYYYATAELKIWEESNLSTNLFGIFLLNSQNDFKIRL